MGKAVGQHLKFLEIDECRKITEFGLKHLELCSGLKLLILRNMKRVHSPEKVLERLKHALPNTEIHFPIP
ncbi:hypothetical protein DICVIV_08789 [Dictyocaulus viviparus]|uniref:ATP synthase subunit s, mitochondrial n=1 Tax=Dictyocaulus viviparus TaxID=29172 RepID=A0A0D8XKZ6_DICVI|nr:hypothetical protein DICVIV_08789 [Dictyocaulus viviparus]